MSLSFFRKFRKYKVVGFRNIKSVVGIATAGVTWCFYSKLSESAGGELDNVVRWQIRSCSGSIVKK
jgi:hypothetical protein